MGGFGGACARVRLLRPTPTLTLSDMKMSAPAASGRRERRERVRVLTMKSLSGVGLERNTGCETHIASKISVSVGGYAPRITADDRKDSRALGVDEHVRVARSMSTQSL